MSVSVCGCCCFSAGCVYFCKSLRVCVCDCVYFFVTRVIIFAQGLLALWFLLCKMPKNYFLLLLLLWNEHWEWFNFLALPHCTCNTNKYLHFYVCMYVCSLYFTINLLDFLFNFCICYLFVWRADAAAASRKRQNNTTATDAARPLYREKFSFIEENWNERRTCEREIEWVRERETKLACKCVRMLVYVCTC